ncbi:MAG: magnesium transporter [Firmicutes bacterium]|nr:magnesium transporter [Bacillota bacterium]
MENVIEQKLEKLHLLLVSNQRSLLREQLLALNEVDIAQFIDEISPKQAAGVFRILPKDRASEVFVYLPPDKQEIIVTSISDVEICQILEDMFTDDTVDFLEEMPANIVKRVLQACPKEERERINRFLRYEANTGGALMTCEFVSFMGEVTVGEALAHIRETAEDKETVYNLYIVAEGALLLGRVPLRTLLVTADTTPLKDIMTTPTHFAYTTDPQGEIAATMRKYDLISLPIVDKEKRLVGIVTIDDAVDVISGRAGEDIQTMAAIKPLSRPYLKTSVFGLSRRRIIWLSVLMLAAVLTAIVIAYYEDMIYEIFILATFIPMIVATAGNAGSQSAALIIRGLAVGEIKTSDATKIIWKEVRIALLCCVLLVGLNFARIFVFVDAGELDGIRVLDIAFVVGIALTINITVANIIGGILPLAAYRVNLDPAIMASPLITTIADVGGIMVYFAVASMWLF